MKKRWSFSDKMYFLGVLLIPLGILAFFAYYHFCGPNGRFSSVVGGCIVHTITGYYCPGCGGTRAVWALTHGQILQSLYYHPFVPYTVFVYLLYMLTHTLERLKLFKVKGLRFHEEFFYVGIAIILLNFFIKNAARFFLQIELL